MRALLPVCTQVFFLAVRCLFFVFFRAANIRRIYIRTSTNKDPDNERLNDRTQRYGQRQAINPGCDHEQFTRRPLGDCLYLLAFALLI